METQTLTHAGILDGEQASQQRMLWSGIATALILVALVVPAIRSAIVGTSAPEIQVLLCILVTIPALVLSWVCVRRDFSLASACAWAWHFVFFGLVPAYQVPAGRFYWGGRFSDQTLAATLVYVVAAEAVLISIMALPRSQAKRQKRLDKAFGQPSSGRSLASERWLRRLQILHIAASLSLIAIIGPVDLMRGRKAFQEQLVGAADIPGSGSTFFLATALSIVVPSAGIYFYRKHATVSLKLLMASLFLGTIVTNPLIGSRFLTGSFLVSILGALTLGRPSARYIPIFIIVALTTIFPSLDLWRGLNQAQHSIAVAWPSDTLLRPDYDAFEMLVRAFTMTSDPHTPQPDPAYLLGGAVFRWVPVVANAFPDAGTGTAVARATGMGFTNVSMPLVGEGLVIGGLPGVLLFYSLLGGTLRWLSRGYAAGDGAVDAATASLLFLGLRGSLYSMLGYMALVILCGYLLQKPAHKSERVMDEYSF